MVELALVSGALGSSGLFLHGFEFVEEVGPADRGGFVARLQARAGWAFEGRYWGRTGSLMSEMPFWLNRWTVGLQSWTRVEEADVADAV